jgi:transcriptional regulator with XRE-family HTH domain
MATRETKRERGRRRARWLISEALASLRKQRLLLGVSQQSVAKELGCAQSQVWRTESGDVAVTVQRLAEMASVLGMELGLGVHLLGDPIRDKGQQALIQRFKAVLAPAWQVSHEALLSISGDGRAWDLLLRLARHSVGVECETRIRDIQAIARKIHGRERDDDADRILVVLSDSTTNRRLADQLREALGARYATSPRVILAALRAGQPLPGSGVVLV